MGIASWLGKRKQNRWAVDKLHQALMTQSLRPEFFGEGGARDNFSGRFEMVCLHAALVFRRLRAIGPGGRDLAQDTFDQLFQGFDEALRDVGTGDLSVGKKIRKLGEAFYGRAKAYDEALADAAADGELQQSLRRNLGVSEGQTDRFVRYVRSVEETLKRHTDAQLLSGELNWPRLP
jgi:cytochrome b pre-mRNA-processing protein 3